MNRTEKDFIFYAREQGLTGRVVSIEEAKQNSQRWEATLTDSGLTASGQTKDEAVAKVLRMVDDQ